MGEKAKGSAGSEATGRDVAGRLAELAPHFTASAVFKALNLAIQGVGPLAGAAEAADKQLADQDGELSKGIHEVIENNVRMAAGQGFATNVGGLIAMAVTAPTNIAVLAFLQCRMVAGIAHLRGYDLSDERVRTAILAALLGEEKLLELVRRKQLPTTPVGIAIAPVKNPQLSLEIANEVANELVSRVAGKRLASTLGRRTPLLGGLVGAGTDAYTTWKIGRYVEQEFLTLRRG